MLRFDESGKFCGITLVGVRHLLKTEGSVEITVPHRENLDSGDLELALSS